MKQAVVFGAGNIGRGFIGQLLSISGFETTFVDVIQDLVDEINERGKYSLWMVTNEFENEVVIERVRAIHAMDTYSVAKAISESSIVFTSVGARALKHIAGSLARGIDLREQTSGDPLNVIVCENLMNADAYLKAMVLDHIQTDSARSFLEQCVGFVMASVGRMVPVISKDQQGGDRLRLLAEPYSVLPIDADTVVGTIPEIEGVEIVRPFEYHVHLKLYCHNCGHAIAAYLGYLQNHEFIYECMLDARIGAKVSAALQESSQALASRHSVPIDRIQSHIDDLLVRFANRRLSDTVARVGRDPIRKLAPDDRLVGAARLAEAHGIEPDNLAMGIAAALRFDDRSDPQARRLQEMISLTGLEATILNVTGIKRGEHLFDLVVQHYQDQA